LDNPNNTSFLETAKKKIMIFDGAMGTSLFSYDLSVEDYGSAEYEGCPEQLNFSRPNIIKEIHSRFFEAGADVVETNTFGASVLVLDEFNLGHKSYEVSYTATKLAREIADEYTSKTPQQPRYVAGSIGPGTKLASLGNISYDELYKSYQPQIRGMIDAGADLLLIETCQDPLQIKACLGAAFKVLKDIEDEHFTLTTEELIKKFPRLVQLEKARSGLSSRIRIPIHVQVTIETMGTLLVGSDIAAALTTIANYPIDTVGMNCATGPKEMREHLQYLHENSPFMISCLPNAGIPENIGGHAHFPLGPEEFAQQLSKYASEFSLNFVGGCCGTTYEHIRQLANSVAKLDSQARPRPSCNDVEESVSSIYNSVPMLMNPKPLIVGERTNANGSKLFRDLLGTSDYEAIVDIAKEQLAEGSHVLDVCTAYVGRDETKDMIEVIKRVNTQVNIPIMVDSTEYPVLEESLKYITGKAVINSVNLEDGEERVEKIAELANKFGASLVVLTIDEDGMAKSSEQKLQIASRLYDLLVNQHGMNPKDLIYDALTFTLASGEEEMRKAGVETIEGIRLIKQKYPEVKTILGLSNISFGLDAKLRPALNSVFLNECIEAGLDMAIASAKKLIPIAKIDPELKRICLDLIYDRRSPDYDPLHALLALADTVKDQSNQSVNPYENLELEELLAQRIIDGNKTNIDKDLDKALAKGHKALDIINGFLMNGMKIVGDRFRSGEMQLPFVLQSATAMKTAVAYLEQFMEKEDSGKSKGSIVLATVKGDVHDIGKNLVDIILTNNGYTVHNIGIKQPIEAILSAVEEHKADVVGMSGLLVKSTLIMKQNLEIMNERGIDIPVILGGSALTRRYVEEDCAQCYKGTVFYGFDAFTDLSLMERICSGPKAEKERYKIYVENLKEEFYKTRPGIKSSEQINPETEEPYEKVGENLTRADAFTYTENISSIRTLNDSELPSPPFLGDKILDSNDIDLDEVWSYMNLDALIIGQWNMGKGKRSKEDYDKFKADTIYPLLKKIKQEAREASYIKPKIIYGYYECQADENNPNRLIVSNEEFIFPRQSSGEYLCLTDYFRTNPVKGSEAIRKNIVAFQIVTIGESAAHYVASLYKEGRFDDYLYHYGLATETTEALAEYAHARIRKELGFRTEDLLTDRTGTPRQFDIRNDGDKFTYHGLRYSFGYPACPRIEDQEQLFRMLRPDRIGLELSEEWQIHPEHSTSAIIVHHPDAKYFNIK
jgi:5-methyltetrahydrofolate--homocysteine methyltransferase